MEGAYELRFGAGVRAEALRHGVDLLLQVSLEVLGDIVDQEVDVPREIILCFDYTFDLVF